MKTARDGPREGLALLALVRAEPVKVQYRTPDLAASVRKDSGSDNLPLLDVACSLWSGTTRLERAARKRLIAFFPASRSCWMGQELGSRIYAAWHFLSVLAARSWARGRGDGELLAAADEWLLHWWCWLSLHRAPSRRVLLVGQRSAGKRPAKKSVIEWMLAAALGEPTVRWEPGSGDLRWEHDLCRLLLEDLVGSAVPLRAALERSPGQSPRHVALMLRPPYGLAVAHHILETSEGFAAWCDRSVNGFTPPVLAAVELRGRDAEWLPVGGGDVDGDGDADRHRRPDHATCTRDGDTLSYASTFYPAGRLRLPAGESLFEAHLVAP